MFYSVSANASSVTRSARADSGFASTRVASKTSGRVALPRRDNFMAPEGAARGPVRYLPCFEIPTRRSLFCRLPSSDDIVRRARTTREETCRRRTLVAACKHVSPASGLARGFSRDRIDRPAIPTTRTTATDATRVAFRPPLFVCTTKRGRHRVTFVVLPTKKRESSFSHRVSFPDVVSCRDKNKTAPARSS